MVLWQAGYASTREGGCPSNLGAPEYITGVSGTRWQVGKRENGSFLNRMGKLAGQKILHLQIRAHTHLLEKLCILILCLKLKMLSYFYYYFFKKR